MLCSPQESMKIIMLINVIVGISVLVISIINTKSEGLKARNISIFQPLRKITSFSTASAQLSKLRRSFVKASGIGFNFFFMSF